MSPVSLLLIAWGVCAALMTALWIWQWAKSDATIVDVGWAAGIVVAVALYVLLVAEQSTRALVVGFLGGLWALRLAVFLFMQRVLKHRTEDGRYQRMRAALGKWAHPAFFAFFQVQASWSVLFSIPMLAAMIAPGPFGSIWDILGVAIWVTAVVGESIADGQLARFRQDTANRGKTCRVGLWRYSRHPNYFFEWLHWFAYIALAIGSPWWMATILGPIVMIIFLFRVTGIPHTEKQALASRGEDYRRYQQTTSVFIPWFPRKEASP